MSHLDVPYRFDGRGRTAGTDDANHIRDLIESVLLTSPGERVMRPDFGSGLLAAVFEPNSVQLAAATQMLAQGALQQHLGHLIAVSAVTVENDDAALRVTVRYSLLRDQTTHVATFTSGGAR